MKAGALIPAAAAGALLIFCALLLAAGYRPQYMELLAAWGAYPAPFPFIDMHAVLAAIACHRLGFDDFNAVPCDVFHRPYVYSPLWLAASVLPVTTAWTGAAGVVLDALFLLGLTWLPPGRGWRRTGVQTLATVSGTVAFAMERANNDLVVFILAVLTVRLVLLKGSWRFLGYAVALFAGMLKFYPATLLILAVRERLTALMVIGLGSLLAITAFIAFYAHDLRRVLALIPTGPYTANDAFSARDLSYGLTQNLGWPAIVAPLLLAVMTFGMIAYAIVLSGRGDLPARLARLDPAESAFLLIGCVLMLACFFTAQNVTYRGVHFLFVLPGLAALVHPEGMAPNRVLATGGGLILLLSWAESVRRLIDQILRQFGLSEQALKSVNAWIWIVRELTWWLVATLLLTLLIVLLRRAPATRELVARVAPPR